MRLKSVNKYYILGIVPLLIIVFTLSLKLFYNNKWLFYSLLMFAVLLFYQLIKKFVFMPRPLKEYGDLKKINFNLPIDYNVELYSSQRMDKYFLETKIVEVFSPLYLKRDENIKVIVNEKLLENREKSFIIIAICRELEKYRRKIQAKVILALLIPVLASLVVLLVGILTKVSLLDYFSPVIVHFLLPFLAVIALLIYLFLWNQYISKQEIKLDLFLTSYFDINDVESYISQVEEMEGRVESDKYKEFNNYYVEKRIKKLRELH